MEPEHLNADEHIRRLREDDDYRNWFDYFLSPDSAPYPLFFDEWMAMKRERRKMEVRCRFGIEPREIKL